MLRRLAPVRLVVSPARALSFYPRSASQAPSISRPGPPPLSAADQRDFDELVKLASRASSDQSAVPPSPSLHPDARRSPPPEFEGDINPVTGERGGPKREPVKHGDWSHGGRVSDF